MLKLKKFGYFKNLILGVGIGIIATSITPVFANIQEYLLTKVEYPIIVNGVLYTNNELPMLNYNGYTFVPLKAVGDMLNANVQWNEELRRVEIGEVKVEVKIPSITTSDELYHTGFPKYAYYNGIEYSSAQLAYDVLFENGYYLITNSPSKQDGGYFIRSIADESKEYKILQDDYIIHGGLSYIKSEIIKSLID